MPKMRFLILLIVFPILFQSRSQAQDQHHTGLIIEDLAKVPWICEYAPLAKVGTLPSSVDLSAHLPPVGDQKSMNSCVTWALGYYLKSYQEWQEYGWDLTVPEHQFSPRFIYNQINNGVDGGSSQYSAVRVLLEQGCVTLAEMPEPSTDYTTLPDSAAFDKAINYRSSSAYYIDCSSDVGIGRVKEVLSEGRVLVLGVPVYGNLSQIQMFDNVYCVADRFGNPASLWHMVTLVGYDDQKMTRDGVGAFKFVNSWGTAWGDKGFAWISYKAMPGLSTRQAIFLVDLFDYTPQLKATVAMVHPSRGTVSIQVGIGSISAPLWSRTFSFPTKSWINLPLSTPMVFDLSEGIGFLSDTEPNSVFVLCADNSLDGRTGTLTSFSCKDAASPLAVFSNGPPLAVPDSGVANATIVLASGPRYNRLALTAPPNGQPSVPLNATLYWTDRFAPASYCLQIARNNADFTGSLYYECHDISSRSWRIYGLDPGTRYFWRVRPMDADTNGWSEVWSFETTLFSPSIGYSVAQSPFDRQNISGSGTPITHWENNGVLSDTSKKVLDDGYTVKPVPLGIHFRFFDRGYDSLFVGINGVVSFTEKQLNSSVYGLPAGQFGFCTPSFLNCIDVAYADLDLGSSTGSPTGRILYSAIGNRFILSWENVARFSQPTGPFNTFQLILDGTSGAITIQVKTLSNELLRSATVSGIRKDDTTALYWGTPAGWGNQVLSDNSSITFKPSAVPLSPTPLTPANNVVSTNLNPSFEWKPSPGAAYYLFQIANNPLFSPINICDSTISTIYHLAKALDDNRVYYWRVSAVGTAGWSAWSSSWSILTTGIRSSDLIPRQYALLQNYPNPFNPRTTIQFDLPKSGNVTLKIFNMLGQEVASLVNERKQAGYYQVTWNANAPSGLYFYRLQAGDYVETKKAILLK